LCKLSFRFFEKKQITRHPVSMGAGVAGVGGVAGVAVGGVAGVAGVAVGGGDGVGVYINNVWPLRLLSSANSSIFITAMPSLGLTGLMPPEVNASTISK